MANFLITILFLFPTLVFSQGYSQSSLQIIDKCKNYGFGKGEIEFLKKNDKDFNINATDKDKTTALMYCSLKGREHEVFRLLENEAFVDAQDINGQTALMMAAKFGQENIVWRLIKSKANTKLRDKHGYTAAEYANRSGHYSIVERLGEKPQNLVNDQKRKEAYDLLGKVKNNQISIQDFEKQFAPYGPLIDEPTSHGQTMLHHAAYYKLNDIVAVVLKLKANPNIQNEAGMTPLMYAAMAKNTDGLKMLLDAGAEPNLKSKDGKTASDYAADDIKAYMTDFLDNKQIKDKKSQQEIISYLQKSKKDSKFKKLVLQNEDKIKRMNKEIVVEQNKKAAEEKKRASTPQTNPRPPANIPQTKPALTPEQTMQMIRRAFTVIDNNDIPSFSALLDRGLPVNARDGNGNPMLHRIAFYGHLQMLQLLIARGANINARGVNGQTALMEAVRNYRYDSATYLIKSGANKSLTNAAGWTAYNFARQNRDDTLMFMTRF